MASTSEKMSHSSCTVSAGDLPKTVALVLHFRDHRRTRICIDSLLPEGIRNVLVVDNSADYGASWLRLANHLERWSEAGLAVTVERPGPNLGFSAGVNWGLACIARRDGEVCVLLLNSDAVLRPGAHRALRKAINGRPPAVASACMIGRDGTATPFAYYQRFLGLLSRQPIPGAYRYLSACCMLIHPALAQIDLFDEAFFFYGEDIELGWRMSKMGIDQIAVAQAKVDHEGSASSRNGSLFYEYHINRGHWLLADKLSCSKTTYVCAILGRTISLPIRSFIRSVRLGNLVPVKAMLMAMLDAAFGRMQILTEPLHRK